MQAVASIIGLAAVAAWALAVWSGMSLVSIAPRGGRLATLFDLGWWRFAAIEARIGPSAKTPIDRYRKAFLAFFLCILAGAAAGVASTAIDAPAR